MATPEGIELDTFYLWDGPAPGARGEAEEDRPRLAVLPAPPESACGTAVIVCPGGGYNVRAMDYEGLQVARWRKVEAWRRWAQLSEGCYLLRSNMAEWTARRLWEAYIQLTQAEAAFRIEKSDLRIRPIWHQREDRVRAHVLVCFLAYVLWKTLAQMCAESGLGEEPRRVFAELGKLRVVDVILPTRQGVEIRKRCVTEPTDHQAILLQKLGLELPRSIRRTKM